jgi:NADPH:quinone reductase-like Zn-dependent oxidoreductase
MYMYVYVRVMSTHTDTHTHVQMAKIRGYKVIGTTSKSKEAVGKATGVDELIVLGEAPGTSYEDYTTVDVVKRVMEITKGEVCCLTPP